MAKQLLFSETARRKMLDGVDILADAVGSTLGPTGRNVILSKSFGGPTVTKDGVTVSQGNRARATRSRTWAPSSSTWWPRRPRTWPATARRRRPFWPARSSARGSRTSPPGPTRRPSAAASRRPSRPPSTSSRARSLARSRRRKRSPRSASISANNDPAIGKPCWPTPWSEVGRDGVITVEEGKTATTTLEFVEGMQFDKGYSQPLLRDQSRPRWRSSSKTR